MNNKDKKVKKIISVNIPAATEKRKEMLQAVEADISSVEGIHISQNNSKLGVIPSFSVLPLVTCGKNCKDCSKYCYACKGYFNFNSNILNLAENTALVKHDPSRVIEELNRFLNGALIIYKYFRFNVAGDIFNIDYLNIIVSVAKANKITKFLVFTKNYELINDYVAAGGKIPRNLFITFSKWGNAEIENPYNFSVAITKIDDATEIPKNAFHCTGDCSQCLECWTAKKKSYRYFDLH